MNWFFILASVLGGYSALSYFWTWAWGLRVLEFIFQIIISAPELVFEFIGAILEGIFD